MVHRIEFSPSAEREFGKLPRQVQIRLGPHVEALAQEPHPHGSEKLSAEEGLYRLRVGDYRLIYSVDDLVVQVVKIGHRRDVYRRIAG